MKCFVIKTEDEHLQSFISLFQKKYGEIHVIEPTSSHDLITNVVQERPDILFTGTKFPRGKRKEIAERLKEGLPRMHLVYVTESTGYAVEAFEVGATDYLLLPVQQKRLAKTLEKIEKDTQLAKPQLFISSFGDLTFLLPSENITTTLRWRTKKAKELFAYLLFRREQLVRKDYLVDLLWPDTNWKQGISLLYSTTYQVRKLIREIGYPLEIENTENHYRLLMNGVTCCVEEWEKEVAQLEELQQNNVNEYTDVMYKYTDDFLTKLNYHWAEMERKRLHEKWMKIVKKAIDFYWQQENYFDVAKINYHVQKVNPMNEESYLYLLEIYEKLGDQESLQMVYRAYEQMLLEELSVQVPKEIIQKYGENIEK